MEDPLDTLDAAAVFMSATEQMLARAARLEYALMRRLYLKQRYGLTDQELDLLDEYEIWRTYEQRK